MDERFAAPGNLLNEFHLPVVVRFAECRLAAHLGAFLLDKKSEV
jgi:hypothetical protein